MRAGTRHRNALILTGVLFAVSGVVAALGVIGPRSPAPADQAVGVEAPPDKAGLGESLVLVVGGMAESEEEAISLAEEELALGELDGFHPVRASDFEIDGVFERAAPLLRPFDCGELTERVEREACRTSPDRDELVALDVHLRYVPLADLAEAEPAQCGTTLPPAEQPMCLPPNAPQLADVFRPDSDVWLSATAFRTTRGAEEFLALVHAVRGEDLAESLLVVRAVRTAGRQQHRLGTRSGPLRKRTSDR